MADSKKPPRGNLEDLPPAENYPAEDAEDKAARRQELRRARSLLPAPYVDSWATITWAGHVRIVLGEGFKTGEIPRMAFMMELDEAESFALYLLEVIARRKSKDGASAFSEPDDK